MKLELKCKCLATLKRLKQWRIVTAVVKTEIYYKSIPAAQSLHGPSYCATIQSRSRQKQRRVLLCKSQPFTGRLESLTRNRTARREYANYFNFF